MVGNTLSHYRILDELGRGGMGLVYKAEDIKLDRIVAIKVLPSAALATDEDRARFYREAKAAAALHHPHIASVFEIDEAAVSEAPHDAKPSPFIAMEFIEGETLAERIRQGPLKLDEAVRIASQIASGLEVAHEKHIVHRDVKSANVMLTARGDAKILDFGLALTAHSTKLTRLGSTLGTVAYMSPEQTRGEEVDLRTDLWALGAVLYEMISGRTPFPGDYDQAVMYGILNHDPEPLTAVRTGVPMSLEWIVTKLLAKDRENRYQSATDLLVDLRTIDLKAEGMSRVSTVSGVASPSGRSMSTATAMSPAGPASAPRRFTLATLGLTALLTAVLASVLVWVAKPDPPPPAPGQPNRMVFSLPENTSVALGWSNPMAISPDGTAFVYIARGGELREGLFLKSAGRFEAVELAGTEAARGPFFSPDGRWIGYENGDTKEMYKVLVDGGEPFKITNTADSPSGTWAPDHTIIYTDDGVLKRVSESGGEPVILTKKRREGEWHGYPHMLPDGKTVLFTILSGSELSAYRLGVYRFGDDDYRVVLDEEGYNAVYSPSGHLVYGRAGRLMAVPFDLTTLTVTGISVPVLDDVLTWSNTGSMGYALSGDGTLVYVPGTVSGNSMRSVLTVDLLGQATAFFDQKKEFEYARYSPDGKYVAFMIDEQDDTSNIWIYNVENGALNQLTFYEGDGAEQFAWSPDSKRLAYATQAEDATNSIFIKNIDGTGTAQKIYTSPLDTEIYVKSWSGADEKISFGQMGESTTLDLFVYSFQDSSAVPYLATPVYEANPYFSPNGKWMVYQAGPGATEVYVRPYPDPSGGLWKISNGGGQQPAWSPDGTTIYYRNGNAMYAVDVVATDVFSKGNPRKMFEGDYFLPRQRRFDIHPDGDRFIMLQNAGVEQGAQQLFVIQHFSEDLKALAPRSN